MQPRKFFVSALTFFVVVSYSIVWLYGQIIFEGAPVYQGGYWLTLESLYTAPSQKTSKKPNKSV